MAFFRTSNDNRIYNSFAAYRIDPVQFSDGTWAIKLKFPADLEVEVAFDVADGDFIQDKTAVWACLAALCNPNPTSMIVDFRPRVQRDKKGILDF